jgi:exodeoxyribonuclease VII large subunit
MSTVPAPSSSAARSSLPGPFPVGTYAAKLRGRLREFTHVQLTGEVWGLRMTRVRVYFELRDATGALACAMWREDYEAVGHPVSDGTVVVVAGGCDLYVGSATASPSFHFAVRELRIAGEGDLLAQLQRLRRRFDAEGLLAPQKALARPALPRCIGVVCAQSGKAGDDVRAGLQRRGWGGRLVWAFAPVQDRRAAPAIAARLRDLAALPEVDLVIVARGGGSLADLAAFCDESLCRTVALLRVPVIASVGHHTDRTLLDDVAAVCCSTPTHAAEAAVAVDLAAARTGLLRDGRRMRDHGRRAVSGRARVLAGLARVGGRGAGADAAARRRELERLGLALAAHDPERTLARGYAIVTDRARRPLGSASDARGAGNLVLRFHDGWLSATVASPDPPDPPSPSQPPTQEDPIR